MPPPLPLPGFDRDAYMSRVCLPRRHDHPTTSQFAECVLDHLRAQAPDLGSPSIEELERRWNALEPGSAAELSEDAVVPDRLSIARDADGRQAIILKERESRARELVLHGRRKAPGLLLVAAAVFARRLVQDPGLRVGPLLASEEYLFRQLAASSGILGRRRLTGLVGELLFLRMLLRSARKHGLPQRWALEKWVSGRHDFASKGKSIDAKTSLSGDDAYLGDIRQGDPASKHGRHHWALAGIRWDASSPRKVPDLVDEVRASLQRPDGTPDEVLRERFDQKLRSLGYAAVQHRLGYAALPGFEELYPDPRLVPDVNVDRIRISKLPGGRLPAHTKRASQTLGLRGQALSAEEAERVVVAFLRDPPVSQDESLHDRPAKASRRRHRKRQRQESPIGEPQASDDHDEDDPE